MRDSISSHSSQDCSATMDSSVTESVTDACSLSKKPCRYQILWLTQKMGGAPKVAKALGVTKSTINKWIAGVHQPRGAAKILVEELICKNSLTIG